MNIVAKMKRDWDRRTRHDARFWIATSDFHDDAEFDSSGEATRLALLHLLGDRYDPKWTVLDVGCGIGRTLRPLARDFGRLYGIDVSAEMIARSRQWLAGLDNVETFETSGVDLARFADESFSLVYSYIVFQHVPRPVFEAYLAEINRVLGHRGLFALQVVVGAQLEPSFDDTITIRAYEPIDLRTRLARNGFELISDLPIPTHQQPVTRPFLLARRSECASGAREKEWLEYPCSDAGSPLDDHLHLCLAQDHLIRGERGAAIDTLSRLVRLNPTHLQGWSELLTLLLQEDRLAEAVAALEAMVRANPDYEPAQRDLAAIRRTYTGTVDARTRSS